MLSSLFSWTLINIYRSLNKKGKRKCEQQLIILRAVSGYEPNTEAKMALHKKNPCGVKLLYAVIVNTQLETAVERHIRFAD